MSEPVSGLTVTGTLAGADLFSWFAGLDYSVVLEDSKMHQ